LEDFTQAKGFDWDEWNSEKIWEKHKVNRVECEQVFFNQPFVVGEDVTHSQEEERFYTLGKTDAGRLLFLVFTIREEILRVITARDMSRRERRIYRDVEKENDS
jgi:uncharacterized DUF497 family protein